MIMAVKEDCGKIGGPQECAGCGKKIHDKYLLKVNHALNIYYISKKGELGYNWISHWSSQNLLWRYAPVDSRQLEMTNMCRFLS